MGCCARLFSCGGCGSAIFSAPIQNGWRGDTAMSETVAVAVLARAPLPGFTKTRLIPRLGSAGAALLQARLIEQAAATACAAAIGPVTVWVTPDAAHPVFAAIRSRHEVA